MTPAAGSEPGGEPRTKAGRSLLGYLSSLKVPGAPDWPEHERRTILAIEREAATPPSSVAERGGLRAVVAKERGRLAGLPVPGSWHNRWGWEAAIREALRSLDAIDVATPVVSEGGE